MVAKDFDRTETPLGVFGTELRYYRTNAGLSQTELAARVNVSHDVISKIETGDRPPAEDFPDRLDGVPEMDTRQALGRLWRQLRKGLRHRAYPGWFGRWADLEAEATRCAPTSRCWFPDCSRRRITRGQFSASAQAGTRTTWTSRSRPGWSGRRSWNGLAARSCGACSMRGSCTGRSAERRSWARNWNSRLRRPNARRRRSR